MLNFKDKIDAGVVDLSFDPLSQGLSLEQLKKRKLVELSSFRFSKETGGIDVGGTLISTDRNSQAMITQAFNALQAGFVPSIQFKTASGWTTVDLEKITAIASAVARHVQKCFADEAVVASQINSIQTKEDLAAFSIAEAWPV